MFLVRLGPSGSFQRVSFGTDVPRTSGGIRADIPAQNFGQVAQILEKQAFGRGHPGPEGADVHDPKGLPKTSVRKLWAEFSFPKNFPQITLTLLLVLNYKCNLGPTKGSHSQMEPFYAIDSSRGPFFLRHQDKEYAILPQEPSKIRAEKTMTATDVTGFDAIFLHWMFRCFLQILGGSSYQLHINTGEKAKNPVESLQWRRRPEIADFCPLSWSNFPEKSAPFRELKPVPNSHLPVRDAPDQNKHVHIRTPKPLV